MKLLFAFFMSYKIIHYTIFNNHLRIMEKHAQLRAFTCIPYSNVITQSILATRRPFPLV